MLEKNEELVKQQQIQTQKQQEQQKQKQDVDIYRQQALASQKAEGSIVYQDWVQEEWLQTEEIPEQVLDNKVREHFQNAHSGSKVGFFERTKAKKESKQKFRNAVRANRARFVVFDEMKTAMDPVQAEYEIAKKNISDTGYTRDIKELVGLIDTDEKKKEYMKKAGSKDEADRVEALTPFMKQFMEMDETFFAQFNVNSDEEIIAKYKQSFSLFNAAWVMSKMSGNYKQYGGQLSEEELVNIKSAALALQTVKVKYEREMNRMQNPYYIMMRKSSFENKGKRFYDKLRAKIERKFEQTGEDDDALSSYISYQESKTESKGEGRDDQGMPRFDLNNAQAMYKMTKADVTQKGGDVSW